MPKNKYNHTNFYFYQAMQVYLVGGAVRDQLLNKTVHDKDFVVVGSDFAEMQSFGFTQVGMDFPVFLHPKTQHEYALARTERKSGTGYQGFTTQTKGVSLADDLLRRDLTINALAIQVKGLFDDTPTTGQVIDFYGGLDDLHHKILRHISPAFAEDPLRILRTVRFFARYCDDGFTVADKTIKLMQNMAQAGDLSHLSRERLWTESVKTMQNGTTHHYWQQLRDLRILPHFLKELDDAWQDDTVFHRTIANLANAKNSTVAVQFAILCSGYLFDDDTVSTTQLINKTAQQLNAPKYPTHIAHLLGEFYAMFHQPLTAITVLKLLEKTKAHQGNLTTLHDVLDAIFTINHDIDVSMDTVQALLVKAIELYKSVSIDEIDKSLQGKAIGLALSELRINKIGQLLSDHHNGASHE